VCELAYGYKPSWVVAPLYWKQSVLAAKSPRQVQHENIQSLLRGITLCTLWIEWNDLVFNNERWNVVKIHKVIWDALLDYGRAAWNRCTRLIEKFPKMKKKHFLRSLIRAGVGTRLFVLEYVALLGGVMMGLKGFID